MDDQSNANASLDTQASEVDTVQEQETSSPPAAEAHEEESNVSGVSTEAEEQNAYREQNKMSVLERQAHEAQQQQETMLSFIVQDEAITREFLKSQELPEDEIENVVSNLREQYPQLWNQKGNDTDFDFQKFARDLQENTIRTWETRNIHNEFFQRHPDLDYRKLTGEKRDQVRTLAAKIDHLARALTGSKEIEYKAALDEAAQIITGKSGVDIEAARRQGELDGLAKANADKSSTFSPSAGSQSAGKGSVSLTAEEREIADRLGMSYDKYAEGKTLSGS